MTTNPDLSTEDLARPGAVRQESQHVGQAGSQDDDRTVAIEGGPGDPAASGGGTDRPGNPAGSTDSDAMSGAGATRTTGSPDSTTDDSMSNDSMSNESMSGGPRDARADGNAEGGRGRPTGARAGEDAGAGAAPGRPTEGSSETSDTDLALLDPADGERFRQRWSDVQARFVDDPQEAVQTADGLVAELMQSLATGFSEHKGRLESQWQSGDQPDTEELRQALRRYRSFFDRLLST